MVKSKQMSEYHHERNERISEADANRAGEGDVPNEKKKMYRLYARKQAAAGPCRLQG